MARRRIKLTGCDRYQRGDELFEKGKIYNLDEAKAILLLRSQNELGRPYFTQLHDEVEEEAPALPVQKVRKPTSEVADKMATAKKKRGRPAKVKDELTEGDRTSADADDEKARAPAKKDEEVDTEVIVDDDTEDGIEV